jgi:hypothetical protein
MSHPRRSREASALAGLLEDARVVFDPEPGDDPSPLKTALHAWRAVEPGATHHLVVQDDIELTDGFLRRVRAGVQLFPDSALAFYCNWNSVNGAAVRLAAAAGATWAEETGAEYFPTLAMVLPSRHIAAYLEFAAPFAGLWRDDDELMREFLASKGIGAVLSVPSLVQHGLLPSLAGNASHGIRRAACFSPRSVPDGAGEALASRSRAYRGSRLVACWLWCAVRPIPACLNTFAGHGRSCSLRSAWIPASFAASSRC